MANLRAVLTKPRISESHQRNAFDCSSITNMAYSTGYLDVCFHRACLAGSHVKLNRRIFQRTAAVNTAAFPTIDTHVEFFYVPIRLLDHYFSNFKLNIQDYNSSLMGTSLTDSFTPVSVSRTPVFDLKGLANQLKGYMQDGITSVVGYNYSAIARKDFALGAARLLDGLGYGFFDPSKGAYNSSLTESFQVNPYMLAAYQKVYYDHFRNTAYESNNPIAYNLDNVYTSLNSGVIPLNSYQMNSLLQYRRVNYRKDYFQALYPALNYVQSSPSGFQQWAIPNSVMYSITPSNTSYSSVVTQNESSGGQTYLGSPNAANGSRSLTTVQQIRAAFALDKLLRASAYAPKHVKDQFEARFGVKGIESDNESVRIGAFMNDIIIREVLQTSKDTTDGSSTANGLGDFGGVGTGMSNFENDDIDWTCKEDCIILGLIYSLPRTVYDSTRLDNWNSKTNREDFVQPEFMDLGLQPQYNFEQQSVRYYSSNLEESGTMDANALLNSVVGYVDRYQEYKIGIDTNRGAFNEYYPLSVFVNHSNYVRSSSFSGVSSDYFKVDPEDMNDIFVVAHSLGFGVAEHYVTNILVKCIVNQNLSVHGQPRI